ncbi:hypothetical protein, partial [Salinibacter virus M31CR41-3]
MHASENSRNGRNDAPTNYGRKGRRSIQRSKPPNVSARLPRHNKRTRPNGTSRSARGTIYRRRHTTTSDGSCPHNSATVPLTRWKSGSWLKPTRKRHTESTNDKTGTFTPVNSRRNAAASLTSNTKNRQTRRTMQTRRSRQIERLGGIPNTGPEPYETDVTVLYPEDHERIQRQLEVEARTELDEH